MKIAFITENIWKQSVGGIESHIFYLTRELAVRGCIIHIFCMTSASISEHKTSCQYTDPSGGRVFCTEIKVSSFVFRVLKKLGGVSRGGEGLFVALLSKAAKNIFCGVLVRHVRMFDPDLVHQHDYIAGIVASKRLARCYPVLFTNHTGQYLFLQKYSVLRWCQKKMLQHFSFIIAPSQELMTQHGHARYIMNGVDTLFFTPGREKCAVQSFRDQYAISAQTVCIVPRRWAPTKGIIYLAQAICSLEDEIRQQTCFLFAGNEGDGFPAYQRQIMDCLMPFIGKQVFLLGNLDHRALRTAMRAADVTVIPSLMEATSLSALESMACGTPVLTTSVGGMPDVVVDESMGWMVPPASAEELCQVITDMVCHGIQKSGAACRFFVEKYGSWSIVAEKTYAIYQDVMRSADEEKGGA